MYAALLRSWKAGKLTEAQIDNAVAKGLITAEQGAYIKAQPRD